MTRRERSWRFGSAGRMVSRRPGADRKAHREGFARTEMKLATKADLYRALWIHGASIVTVFAALELLP